MLSKCTVAKWLAWGVARLESDRYAIVPFSDSTGAPTSMVGDDRLPPFLQGSQIYGPPPGAAGAESTKPGDDSWASSNVWICCDKCNRWRRVPKGVPTPSEDEPWDCSMNTWDYRYASCAVEEEPEATRRPRTRTMQRHSTILVSFMLRAQACLNRMKQPLLGFAKRQTKGT